MNQKRTENKSRVLVHIDSPTLDVIVHFRSRDQEILVNVLVHSGAIVEARVRKNYMAPCLYLPDNVSLVFFHGLNAKGNLHSLEHLVNEGGTRVAAFVYG